MLYIYFFQKVFYHLFKNHICNLLSLLAEYFQLCIDKIESVSLLDMFVLLSIKLISEDVM
jgi:hypothetical protein